MHEARAPSDAESKVAEVTSFPQVRDDASVAAIVDLLEAHQARTVFT
jgi:predicted transcriptional regulator